MLSLHPGQRLIAATHNPGKAREIAALLDGRFELIAAGESLRRRKRPLSAMPF